MKKVVSCLQMERAGISRATLWSAEKGTTTVSVGTYAAVLHALGGMDKDLGLVAKDAEFGRHLQDLNFFTGSEFPDKKKGKRNR